MVIINSVMILYFVSINVIQHTIYLIACYHVVVMCCILTVGSYRPVYNIPVSWHSGRCCNYSHTCIINDMQAVYK